MIQILAFSSFAHKSPTNVHGLAKSLLNALARKRSDQEKSRPILFIAHSLGGIIIKQALLLSKESRATNEADLRSIFQSTIGIIFGTPHQGVEPRKLHLVLPRIARLFGIQFPEHIVDASRPRADLLQSLFTSFRRRIQENS